MKRQYIGSIKLTNFQKHRKLQLDLSPGINVIAGETNRGKSSIHRAFKRLCTNTPSGATCVRFGKTKAHVEVTVVGESVRRIHYTKSKTSGTSYSVDQSHYKRCGRSVPDEVTENLRINPDINIQAQHQLFFLLDGKSAQERAKQLARGTNIDIIGFVVAEARKQCNHFESLRKAKHAEASEASAELKEYETLEHAERLTRLAVKADSKLQADIRKHRRLQQLGSTLQKIQRSEEMLSTLPNADSLQSQVTQLQELKKRKESLSSIQAALTTTEPDLSPFQSLIQLDEDRKKLIQRKDKLLSVSHQYYHLVKAERVKIECVAHYRKLLGKVCITCGRPL